MANHCWVCPSKHKEEFYDPLELTELLSKEFKDKYIFDILGQGEDGLECIIRISRYVHGLITPEVLFNLWCYTESFANEDDYINNLDANSQDLGDQFIKFKEQGDMDLSRCIEIRHSGFWKDEELITNWMRQYFQALIFDEGIYYFMPPIPETEDYRPSNIKKAKGIIKKFKQWLGR
jgi:hypothetical protein